MEYLQTWLDNSDIPSITAFLLGLLSAVSPCPFATNITAIGFISKDINKRNRIFTNGILYTLGRVLAYSALGAILIAILRKGADMFAIQKGIPHIHRLMMLVSSHKPISSHIPIASSCVSRSASAAVTTGELNINALIIPLSAVNSHIPIKPKNNIRRESPPISAEGRCIAT